MFDFGNEKAKKIESLEQCKRELEDEIKALELQLDGKIQLLTEREKTLSHTQAMLENTQTEIKKINQENGEIKSQLAKKTQELETLARQWSENEDNLKESKQEQKELNAQLHNKNIEVIRLENENEALKSEVEGLLQEKASLQEELARAKQSIQTTQKQFEKIEKEQNETKNHLTTRTQESQNLNKELNETKAKLKSAEDTLKKKIEQYQKAELQIKSLEGERQALTNEKYILQKEVTSTRKDLEDVKKTLDTNINSLSKTQEKYEGIEKDKMKLEQEVKKLNQSLETLQYESTLTRSQIEEEMQEKMFSIIRKELNISNTKTKLSVGEDELVEASDKDKDMDQPEESKEILDDSFSLESVGEIESVRIASETLRVLLNCPEIGERFAELKNKIKGLMILCEDKEIEERVVEFFQATGITRTLELIALFEDEEAIEFLRRYIQSKGEGIRYSQLLVLSIMAYSKADSKQRDLIEKNDLASRGMLEVCNEISKENKESRYG